MVEDATVLGTKSEVDAGLAEGVWESDTTDEDLLNVLLDESTSERAEELAAPVGAVVGLSDDALEVILEIEKLGASLGCAEVVDATVLDTKAEVDAGWAAGDEEGVWEPDTLDEDLLTALLDKSTSE